MTEFFEAEIGRLHLQLAELYRKTPGDTRRINGLWARIERLQSLNARLTVKEANRRQLVTPALREES